MRNYRQLVIGSLATTAMVLATSAIAQNSPSGARQSPNTSTMNGRGTGGGSDRYSWLPYTRNGYVGLNLGVSDYDTDCGNFGACDKGDLAGKIYTGGMFNRHFGLELAYLHTGRAERAGGTTRAHGLNVSAVGRLPLGSDAVALFAKAGGTYGRTNTTAAAGSGVATGEDSGFGPSYGAGLSVDLTRNWAAVLEWERHRFEFAGGNDWVAQTTLGVKYQF